ncbi:MAG: starch-binding protein [Lachnospiraceae bacterium]|nr:starch-binding protein [Lachnospiraceae bacterium]
MKKIVCEKKDYNGRRKTYKGIGLVATGLVCILIMMGIFWYIDSKRTSYAQEETWVNWDLAKMEEPVNHTDKTLTTARATFYDIYSDSQVWDSSSGNYYSKVQPITDGVDKDNGNTFTRFNVELATSLNDNGKEYQYMYNNGIENNVEGVYPLYCGLTWPAQFKKNDGTSWGTAGFIDDSDEFMLKQRWGNLVSDKTFGWWFAAANSNQYSNDDEHKVSVLGVPGKAQGAAAQGLVNRELENGNITIGHGDYKRVLPFFDQEYLEQSYTGKVGEGTNETITEKIRNATFYVQVSKNDFDNQAPHLYVYGDGGKEYNGKFPGELMEEYGEYYVYCRSDISSANVILSKNSGSKLIETSLSGYNEWKWAAYNPNNVNGFISCSKPILPPTAEPTTTTQFVTHGHVVSNIAFPFRKGEDTTKSGLKIRVKKSDFSYAPNVHVYDATDANGNAVAGTGTWPGPKMTEDGEYYVYSNANITGEAKVVLSNNGGDKRPADGGYTVSGTAEYDFKSATFSDSSKVYFSDEKGEKTDPDYYYFDSYSDVIQLDETNKRVEYFHGEKQVQDTDGINGFFPYNKAGEVKADKTNLNYVHGVKMELDFNMTGDGKIKGKDITFEFTGDDDLWVFVDGYLVLDIGGAHIPISGNINFAEKKATVDYVKKQEAFASKYRDGNYGGTGQGFDKDVVFDFGKDSGEKLYELLSDTTRNHTLTIFYMERGKGNSNLKIKFNLPQISTMSVGNEVDASDVNKSLQTDALWKACNQHKFQYYLENKGTEEGDYDNSITDETTPIERNVFAPIGLAAYRKKVTSEDGAAQRLRFFTFADTNYFSMVVAGTSVNLPTLRGDGAGEAEAIVGSDGCATINGQEYVFMGWTKDENYRDHWEEIQNDTYTGTCPKLETDGSITVTESTDYYAVWVKKNLTVTYYDEVGVDTPLGYQTTNNKVACIGHEVLSMDKLVTGYKNGDMVINWWNNSDLSNGVTETNKQRTKWKTDETRKGFILNGWRLSETKEDKYSEQILYNYFPLCNVKLYADWTRTHHRVQFKVKDAKQIRTESGTSDTGDGNWKSDIVYFPVGTSYVGYLPYMTDSSRVGDFKEVIDENTTYFDFHSLPVWDNHAIVRWTQNDEEETSYRTTKIVENGKTLYPQEWELGKSDVVFEGEWKQITSVITYVPGDYPESDDLNWENVKKKYTIGQTLYSPNVGELFGEEDTGDWDIVGWKQGDKTVSFPYTVTEEDVVWTAVWKKVSGTVTYHFNDTEIGITGIPDYRKVSRVGSAVERLTLEGMGSSAPYDPVGSVGKNGSHTTYYVKKNGKAYVIAGWKDSDGNKADSNTKVAEEDTEVTAIWKEVHTVLNIIVEVPDEDKSQWDNDIAKNNGWNKEAYEGGTKWTKSVNMIPGELFSSYFDPDNGQLKDILYGAVKGKKLQYNTITYPGENFQLDDADAKVPYTTDSHECSVTGNWTQGENVVTFAYLNPGERNIANARVIGYQTYQTDDIDAELPKSGDVLMEADIESRRSTLKVPNLEGYELSGWTTSGFHEVLSEPAENMDNVVLYTVWTQSETNDDSEKNTGIKTQTKSVSSVVQQKSKNVMRLFGFSSTNSYVPFANELYELDDLLLDGMATGRTGADGGFRLTYDQVASFMNCFSINSSMRLREMNKIYSKDGAEIADRQKMYTTTWELRDIHGYITNRANNKDLKRMSVLNGEDAVIYDGRIEGERTEAFKFGNENEAQGASYATSLRALFTHKIKTSDLTITKKLTETAASVAARKGEEDQDYIFKVSFYHIFGDTTNNDKLLYKGNYVKLNKYGNYIRDDQNKIKEYTAEDGKIILKNGETAIISGIPVMTEYDIEEEDAKGKKDTYILSYAEEITAKGLAGENKKYAVSDINNIESEEYLQKYEDNTYTKEMINNREKLENKKLAEYDEITSQINRTIQGQIGTAGYTYNYVIENEVLIDGISLYIEKIIDEFYYDDNERFYEDVTYQELSHAKQTFIFKIKYTPVDENGSPKKGEEKLFEEVVTFDPEDGTMETVTLPENMQSTDKKKGYKKTVVVLGLEPGYYEISEDEGWSWKYDLMGTFEKIHKGGILNTIYATTDRNVCKNDKDTSKKSYRCYIRGTKQAIDKDAVEVTYDGKKYRLLDNAEEPNVSFLNMKAIDKRKDTHGDTDIETNKILLPTPTPNPNKYKNIRLDDAYNNKELLVGEKLVLPKVKAEKQDGTVETIIAGSSEWSKLKWSVAPSGILEVVNNTLVAKSAGQATVTVEYLDGDGQTRHTASITMKVVASHKLSLSGNNSIPYQLIYSSQKLGIPPRNYPATNAVDGDKNTLWITNSDRYGENVYWGLEFKDANDKFMTRKINKVCVQLEQSDCNRTVEVFAITSIKGQKDFERISCGKKVLEHGVGTMLEFDVDPVGDYYGIQIVLLERSGGVAWPAIAEVEIYGD